MEGNPLLRDDAFQNEHSRNLFDAIERLRSCNVNQDLELPEVTSKTPPIKEKLSLVACDCWRPVRRQVIASSKFDRYPFPSCQQRMHSFSYTYHFSEGPGATRNHNDGID